MTGCGVGVVPAESLLPAHGACPVCGAEGDRRAVILLQDAPPVPMLECATCFAVSAAQFPNDAYLSSLYDPSHYSSSLVADPKLSARAAASILAEVSFRPDSAVEILDYGGSEGTLSREIRKQLMASGHRGPVSSTVVDLFVRPDTEGQRFITPDTFRKEERKYNLLLASAVIEHLTDLRPVFDSILAKAAPGSYFYGRTPYDVPLAKLPGGYKIKWPRHLHDLGPNFWDRFMDTFNVRGKVVVSRPSIVETSFAGAGIRTLLAHVLKAPARLENAAVRPLLGYRGRLWHLVGGWEVVIALD